MTEVFEFQQKSKDQGGGKNKELKIETVPIEVLGDQRYAAEPDWQQMPMMQYMTFFKGLRERNWTSSMFDEHAVPWKIEFFKDSGRFLRPVEWSGYRAVVSTPDGTKQWVDLSQPGAQSYLAQNYTAGGTSGAIWKAKAIPQAKAVYEYGYNQVFEELFAAYEQRLAPEERTAFIEKWWLDPATVRYDCPGARLLDISFHYTTPEVSLHGAYEKIPSFLFFSFAFSFVGVAVAFGLFNPKKQMPADLQQAMEFAQSKGQARKDGRTEVRFADVAGMDATLRELQEVVDLLKNPDKYKGSLQAKPPKGVLLEGGPGTGKTLVAKAIAGEAGVPFYQMSGSEFVEAIVGVGAARIRDLFKRARVNKPCVVFVDEIDAIGIRRAEGGVKTNEEREQTLNQLLTEMDGFTSGSGVIFVAATNRADLLDPALLRAGRFDKKIVVNKPDTDGRHAILRVHARRHPLSPEVDLLQLARDTPGLSGADLANVLNEAALNSLRRSSLREKAGFAPDKDAEVIVNQDIYDALDRILYGVRRDSLPKDSWPAQVFAVHEAGKALVATVLQRMTGRLEAVERVSIIPRGRGFSFTDFARLNDESYLITTRGRLLERLCVLIAGRAAEEVAFGIPTTYGHEGLGDAMRIANKIVMNYGMTKLGVTMYAPPGEGRRYGQRSFEVAVDNIDEDLFGRELRGGSFQPTDATLHHFRTETTRLVEEAYGDCIGLLRSHKEALTVAAKELLEKDELLGTELGKILDAHPPDMTWVEFEKERQAKGMMGVDMDEILEGVDLRSLYLPSLGGREVASKK